MEALQEDSAAGNLLWTLMAMVTGCKSLPSSPKTLPTDPEAASSPWELGAQMLFQRCAVPPEAHCPPTPHTTSLLLYSKNLRMRSENYPNNRKTHCLPLAAQVECTEGMLTAPKCS